MADENTTTEEQDAISATIDDLEGSSVSANDQDQGNEGGQEGQETDSDNRQGTEQNQTTQGQQTGTDTQNTGGPQDLTLPNGQVVKSGAERRIYERNAYEAYQQAPQLRQENENLKSQVTAFQEAASSAERMGLTPQEVTTAHNIMSQLKIDPIATINYLLTEVKAAGHNIEGIGSGIDAAAIQAMITKQLEPIVSRANTADQQEQARQQATQTWENFKLTHPNAAMHEQVLTQLLVNDRSLTLETAYLKLENYCLKKGLDFNKPFVQANGQGDTQTQLGSTLPRGHGGNGIVPVDNDEQVADENAAYSDIVRDAMRDAGMSTEDF
jgi:hypothetical protein|tara:strand:+ start:1634 stop:2611 length:978 start_codon:yes stop_codon:yes gene_type:complete